MRARGNPQEKSLLKNSHCEDLHIQKRKIQGEMREK